MVETTLKVVNHLGLHARAAAQLVKLAAGFKSTLVLVREDGKAEANAKSMLSLLGLGAAVNTKLVLRADGADEEKAVEAIGALFSNGFGEL